MNKNINTPYDDVFRTMLEKVPRLIIPVVNETMGTTYNKDEEVILQLRNEHHTLQGEIIEDSNFIIAGDEYHYECQSNPDDTIAIRIIEYDFARALEIALEGRREDGYYHLKFPRSGILYLRSNQKKKKSDTVIVDFPDGTYKKIIIPIIHVPEYKLEYIIEKGLIFFLPFYMMRYEKALKSKNMEKVETALKQAEADFEIIETYLSEYFTGDSYTLSLVTELTTTVIEGFLGGRPEIIKRIGDIMGGKILKTKTDEIYNLGKEEGIEKGIEKGMEKGRGCAFAELVADGLLSISDAAKKLGITEEVFRKTFMM